MKEKIEIPLGKNPDTGLEEKLNVINTYLYFPNGEDPYIHVTYEKSTIDKKGNILKFESRENQKTICIKDFDCSLFLEDLRKKIIDKIKEA